MIFICFALVLGINVQPAFAAKKIRVMTTTSDLKSIAQFIGGESVEVTSLVGGTENPHFISPKPSYMIKARNADLFIRNGFDLEAGWESLVIDGARNSKIQVGNSGHLDASKGISPMDISDKTIDRSMGDIHARGNPHYWLDPLNAKIIASNIAERLSELSPEDAPSFKSNLDNFHRKIDEKMKEWRNVLAPYKGEKLITYHKTWSYFANRFGFVIADQLEPKPGISPSPTHLKEIVDLSKRENIRIILNENVYKDDAARYVADRTNARVVIAPISVGGDKMAKDYFSLIDIIVQNISGGFEQ